MRKYILCILIAVCTVGCAFALAACAAPSMHNFSSSWFCDEDVHYHGCTDAGCAARADEEEHNWVPVDGKVERAPGCGIPGYGECVCTICGATEKRNIPATGNHRWEYVSGEERPATCVEGFKNKKCRVCGAVEVEIVPPVAEHSWDEWEDDNPDETGTEGTCRPVCSVCGLQGDPQPHVMGDESITVVEMKEETLTDGINEKRCKNCGHAMEQETIYAPNVPAFFDLDMKTGITDSGTLISAKNYGELGGETLYTEITLPGYGTYSFVFKNVLDRNGNPIDAAKFKELTEGNSSENPPPIEVRIIDEKGITVTQTGTGASSGLSFNWPFNLGLSVNSTPNGVGHRDLVVQLVTGGVIRVSRNFVIYV